MQIQGSINQLLTTAAVAAKLDPNVEKRAEAYKAKQDLKRIGKSFDVQKGEAQEAVQMYEDANEMYKTKIERGFTGEGDEPAKKLYTVVQEEAKNRLEKAKVTQEEYGKALEKVYSANPTQEGLEDIMSQKAAIAGTEEHLGQIESKSKEIETNAQRSIEEKAAKEKAKKEKSKVTRQQKAQQKAQESLAARQFEINILKGTPSEHRLYKGEKK
jgi:hypothetical protein